jgi:hypothetical protein
MKYVTDDSISIEGCAFVVDKDGVVRGWFRPAASTDLRIRAAVVNLASREI